MVNLTTLAPQDIVAAILDETLAALDETLAADVTLFELAVDPPALREGQWGRDLDGIANADRDSYQRLIRGSEGASACVTSNSGAGCAPKSVIFSRWGRVSVR
jgi:hypothetical protein